MTQTFGLQNYQRGKKTSCDEPSGSTKGGELHEVLKSQYSN